MNNGHPGSRLKAFGRTIQPHPATIPSAAIDHPAAGGPIPLAYEPGDQKPYVHPSVDTQFFDARI
jgi:hypothetical protein